MPRPSYQQQSCNRTTSVLPMVLIARSVALSAHTKLPEVMLTPNSVDGDRLVRSGTEPDRSVLRFQRC